MSMMIHGKYINQGENLGQVLQLRKQIFAAGEDAKDADAVQVLVSLVDNDTNAETYIGCGRLILDMDAFAFVIDYVGILADFRRNGYGEFALRALVDKVNQCGADCVYIDMQALASEEAKAFFTRFFFRESEQDPGVMRALVSDFHTCNHDA